MEKENLNWRSIADTGTITTKWNAATPGYYIIDAKGVIRHKGLRGDELEKAVEKLVAEVSK